MEVKGLNENRPDEKGKLEYSKLVRTHPCKITLEQFGQGLPRRVHSREVGFFLVKLTQASNNSPKQEVT